MIKEHVYQMFGHLGKLRSRQTLWVLEAKIFSMSNNDPMPSLGMNNYVFISCYQLISCYHSCHLVTPWLLFT